MKKLLLFAALMFSLVFVSNAQSAFSSTSYSDNFDDGILTPNAQEAWWNNTTAYTSLTESGGKLNVACVNADQNFSAMGLLLTPSTPIDIRGTRTIKMTVTNPSATGSILIRCDLRLIDPTFTGCSGTTIDVNTNVINSLVVPPATTSTLTFNYGSPNAAYTNYSCSSSAIVHPVSQTAWTQAVGFILYINPGAGESWCNLTNGTCTRFTGTVQIDDLVIGGAPNPDINIVKSSNSTNVLTGSTTTIPDVVSGTTGTAQLFTIQNNGSATLNISNISLSGPNSSEFSFTSTANSIAPGATGDLYITFAPASVANGKSATLTIDNNDADELSYVFTITANGLSYQEINVKHGGLSGPSIPDEQSVTMANAAPGNTPAAEAFSIENTGGVPLTISDITITGDNSSEFILGNLPTLPTSIAAGQSWTFSVTFTPLTFGIKNATLNITSNDTDEGDYTIPLTAEAVVANEVKASQHSILSSRLYPNPVERSLNLELALKNTSAIRVTLNDLLGKEITTLAEGTTASLNKEVSVAAFPHGLYTVTYFVDGIAAKSELLMVK